LSLVQAFDFFQRTARENALVVKGSSSRMRGLAFALDPSKYGDIPPYLSWWSRMELRVSGAVIWGHQTFWASTDDDGDTSEASTAKH